MRFLMNCLLWAALIMGCNDETSDIEKLIGVWEAVNEDFDKSGTGKQNFMHEILRPPVLEIIDEKNCKLTFLGVDDIGKMTIDEKKKTIKLKWAKSDVSFNYSTKGNGTIMMNTKKHDFILKKTERQPMINSKSIQEISIGIKDLIGLWRLTKKIGGGKNGATDFMLKESGSMYHFLPNDQIEIKYSNGTFEKGQFAVEEKKNISLTLGNTLKAYECVVFSKDEMRIKDKSSNAVITLVKVDNVATEKKIDYAIERHTSQSSTKNKNKEKSNEERYLAIRKDIIINFNDYIKKINARKTGNLKAFAKIKEDMTFMKESKTLKKFIEACPRISEGVVEEYLNGFEAFINTL